MKNLTTAEIIRINEKAMDGWFRYCEAHNYTHPFTAAICYEFGECDPDTDCPLARAGLCGGDQDAKEALAKELITTGKFQLD